MSAVSTVRCSRCEEPMRLVKGVILENGSRPYTLVCDFCHIEQPTYDPQDAE